mgnify:CR=1 FL=1
MQPSYDNDQLLAAAPFSYREGCVVLWRLASDQVSTFLSLGRRITTIVKCLFMWIRQARLLAAKAKFDRENPDAAKKKKVQCCAQSQF